MKHTGRTYKAIEDALERDKFLTADQARDFGIVDKVIDKRLEEPTAKALQAHGIASRGSALTSS